MKTNVAKRTSSAVTAIATLNKDKVEDATVNAHVAKMTDVAMMTGDAMMIDVATMTTATPDDAMTGAATMTTVTITIIAAMIVLHAHNTPAAITNVITPTPTTTAAADTKTATATRNAALTRHTT